MSMTEPCTRMETTAIGRQSEARELDQRIDQALGDTFELLAEAYRSGAWLTLGYESWADYLAAKAGVASLRIPAADRPAAFGRFRDAGMSNRQIAAAVGVSPPTVDRAFAATNVAAKDHGREDVNAVMASYLTIGVDTLQSAGDERADVALGFATWEAYADAINDDMLGGSLWQFANHLRAMQASPLFCQLRGHPDFDTYCRDRVPFLTAGNIAKLIEISAILDRTRVAGGRR